MPVQNKPICDRSQYILENLPRVFLSMFNSVSEINYRQKTLEEIYIKLNFSSNNSSVKTPVMNLLKKYLKSQKVIERFEELLKIPKVCQNEKSVKDVQNSNKFQSEPMEQTNNVGEVGLLEEAIIESVSSVCQNEKSVKEVQNSNKFQSELSMEETNNVGEVGWREEAVIESNEAETMEESRDTNISLLEVYLDETKFSDVEQFLLETNIFQDPLEEPDTPEDETPKNIVSNTSQCNSNVVVVEEDKPPEDESPKNIESNISQSNSNEVVVEETQLKDDNDNHSEDLNENLEDNVSDLSVNLQLKMKTWLEDIEQCVSENDKSCDNDLKQEIELNANTSENFSTSFVFNIDKFLTEARGKHPETFRDFIDKGKNDVNTKQTISKSKIIDLIDSPTDPGEILLDKSESKKMTLREKKNKLPIYEIHSSDSCESDLSNVESEPEDQKQARPIPNWIEDENTIFVDIEDYERIFYVDPDIGPFKLRTKKYVDYFNDIFELMGPCAVNSKGYNLKNTLTIYLKCIFWNCREYCLSGKPTKEGMKLSIKYQTQSEKYNPNAEVYHKDDDGVDLKLVRPFRGSRREELKVELVKKYPLEFIMDKTRQVRESQFKLALLRKGNMQDIPSHGQALKMRQEKLFELHDLSKNAFEDLQLHYLEDQKSEDPYIQLLSYAPLHIMMWSKAQIQALKKFKKQPGPTMTHVDGTSNMAQKVGHSDRQLQLYAMVISLRSSGQRFENDPYSETPVSIFITSSFTALDFKYWFMKFEREVNYQKTRNGVTGRENIFERVVTDRSLPLIYGVLGGMNNMADLNEYLDYTYRLIHNKFNRNTRVTFVHLCCNHLMHNVSNDVNIFFPDKSVANLIKELIGAMVSIQEYGDLMLYWKKFAILLLTKCSSSDLQNVLTQMKFAAKLNIKIEQAIEVESGKPPSDKHKIEREKSTMYENSPYYKDCMEVWTEVTSQTNDIDGSGDNKFYNPKFGVYFMQHYGSWFPLWTGLTWKFGDYPLEVPPSNSHIECAWANMKRIKAQQAVQYGSQTQPLKIGRLIQQIQQPIKEQVFSFMEEIPKLRATNYKRYATKRKIDDDSACPTPQKKTAITPKTPKNTHQQLVGSQRVMSASSKSTFSLQDKFKKRPTRNKTRFLHQNRVDGKHSQLIRRNPFAHIEEEPLKKRMKPKNLINIIEETTDNEFSDDVIEVIFPDSKTIPIQTEETENREKVEEDVDSKIINPIPVKMPRSPRDKKIFESNSNSNDSLWADDSLDWLNIVPQSQKLDNGLCANPDFYNNFPSDTVNFKVTRYLINGKPQDLTLESFKYLRNDSLLEAVEMHLNDHVIDALLSYKIEEAGNPKYVYWDCLINSQKLYSDRTFKGSIFHNRKYSEEQIFIIPYCDLAINHWSLILVNLLEKTVKVIDPRYPNEALPKKDKRGQWLKRIENFFKIYDKQHGTKFYTKGKWEMASESNQTLPNQTDDFNCGIYIIMYVEMLFLGKKRTDLCNFDANNCRTLYQKQLLQYSLNMSDLCLTCCSEEKERSRKCNYCNRWICSWCCRRHNIQVCILCKK